MIIRSLYIVASIKFKALNFVIFFNCINMVRAVLMVSQMRGGGGREANMRLQRWRKVMVSAQSSVRRDAVCCVMHFSHLICVLLAHLATHTGTLTLTWRQQLTNNKLSRPLLYCTNKYKNSCRLIWNYKVNVYGNNIDRRSSVVNNETNSVWQYIKCYCVKLVH